MEKNNNIYNSIITGYGYDGEGISRLNGKVCFIKYVLKDEEISFKITKENSSFCKGDVFKILKSSRLRENPPCPYFSKCGGCSYQHTSYQNELSIKKDLLKNQLKKVGYCGEVNVFSSPEQYGYRNKIKLFVEKGEIGLKKSESNKIIDIDKCLLVDDLINTAIRQLRLFIETKKLYNDIKEIVIRQENQYCLINFIMKTNKNINFQGLYLILGTKFGIYQTYKNKSIYKLGQKFLYANEFGLNAKFNINSFHQVNKYLTEKLYSDVIDNVVGSNVINCYSGAGILSGVISKNCKKVFGVELGENEHNDAESLKKENNLSNLFNIHGDCAKVLNTLNQDFETIIVDPPRGGMDKTVVESINKSMCKRLIYISCNSATLVRDLVYLNNFEIKSVNLYDMFARTGEYETLVILNRKI